MEWDKLPTKKQVYQTAWEPVFWSVLALADIEKPRNSRDIKRDAILRDEDLVGTDFEFIGELDDMKKPNLDNVDTFAVATWAVKDNSVLSEAEFYNEILPEFPGWIKDAHRIRMIILK